MGCCCSEPKAIVKPIQKPVPVQVAPQRPPPRPKTPEPIKFQAVEEEFFSPVKAPVVEQKFEPGWGPENDMERKYWHVLKNYRDYKFSRVIGDGSYGEVIEVVHRQNGEKMKIYA